MAATAAAAEEEEETPTPPRTTSSPSLLSPVGNTGGYSMALDDDEDHDALNNISPIPHPRHTSSSAEHNDNDNDNDDNWQYYDDDEADPPRLRLESDLQTALMGTHHNRLPAKLNGLNYLNVLTYLVHVFVSYGIGVWGLGGILPTRWDIAKQYETLISPAEWAYYLWAPILFSEAIFVIAQLFPHYRARPIIQQGTGYFFFYTCLIQIAWTLFFAFKLFVFSFVAAVAALLSLASLLASQQFSQVRGRKSLVEYWLFRFPFYLHVGWLILCSVVQFSLLFRTLTSNIGVQLAADIVALGAMLPAATFFLTGQPSGPDFVIPLVIVWSYVSGPKSKWNGVLVCEEANLFSPCQSCSMSTSFEILFIYFTKTITDRHCPPPSYP
jgi:hypothetical protein